MGENRQSLSPSVQRKRRRNRVIKIATFTVIVLLVLNGIVWLLVYLKGRAADAPVSCVSEGALAVEADSTTRITTTTGTTCPPVNPLPSQEIPVILQNPELPTGCESTAAVMVLNAYGYEVDKTQFARELPKGTLETYEGLRYAPHPDVAFTGDPFTPYGYGVFSGVISETMQAFIDSADGLYRARNLAGAEEDTLCAYVNRGIPVCVWTTMGLQNVENTSGWYIKDGDSYTDEYFSWPGNEHCVVMVGCDEETVTVHDPLKGKVNYDRDTFFQRYQDVGQYAVVLEPK